LARLAEQVRGFWQRLQRFVEQSPMLQAGRNLTRSVLLLGSVVSLGLVNTPPAVYVVAILLTAMTIPVIFLLEPAGSNYRLWTVYLISFVLFAHFRGFADETSIPIRFRYVIDLETAFFGGVVPTEWLQARLYTGHRGPLELILIAVHLSYFLVPHAMALLIWRKAPQLLARYAAAAVLIFGFGLLLYYLVPTAPPWYAGEHGYLTHAVRIISDLGEWRRYGSYSRVYNLVGDPNPVAAMPSVHTALTMLVALGLGRWHPRLWWLGWGYVAAMTFALVYLGEHYVVDAVAGIAVAALAWRLSRRFDP
jgi:membrane-associated phospholipid phosphatase